MAEENEFETSPLSQSMSERGVTVEICIYRCKGDPKWILEVVDQGGGSTVWEETFLTDAAALSEAMETISKEGISTFLNEPPTRLN